MLSSTPTPDVDLGTIDFESDAARRYWTAKLHCSKTVLRHAVASVGNNPVTVRRYLAENPHVIPLDLDL